MVDFHEPAQITKESAAFINFVLCLGGIFIWEFFISLKFDWDHSIGKRKFHSTFVLYFLSRIGALGTTICNIIIGFDATHQINCQLWNVCGLILGFTAFACASVLMALRVIAIWTPNRIVAVVAIATTLTNMAFIIYGVAVVGILVPISCIFEVDVLVIYVWPMEGRYNITATMASDAMLLIVMLVGLLRTHQTNYGINRHLYTQGLIWLTAATIAEVPAAVFINLNLNDPWNMMFQDFALFTMVICATRMYRTLANNDMEVEMYSCSTAVLSQLRFEGTFPNGTTVSADSNSALPMNHLETSSPCSEGVEKMAAVGDEEAQSRALPSLLLRDGQSQAERDN